MLVGRTLKSGRLAFVVGATALAALLLMVGLVKATECNRFNALATPGLHRSDTFHAMRTLSPLCSQRSDCEASNGLRKSATWGPAVWRKPESNSVLSSRSASICTR
jgi:hypothetical protein